ncbi:hypothetical protein [Crocosphaera sp. XPORK-15E]|uniref:hypothetical protein n=1 Tax=Crocosphaera sp. XPORK-15E TaxID=3110247 RepID=UPI002B2000F7|nr:hypothetical protein [Crocosphaera sp. XPORK-15E]MEA5536604.1 hypothetical protein [Crocosphaera sp. XPORK-15E]
MVEDKTGWYITTNDIKNWTETNKRQAEEILPLLVKMLIRASCKPKKINFPSGNDIAVGGWDGVLEVDEGNQFIPSGTSGWEFGTNKSVKDKADDDYLKRLKNPDPFELDTTTFVFVTSRLWTQKDNWVNEKKSDNKWKGVEGINAQDLSNWLEDCSAVHRWFSQLLGKRCTSTLDIEQAWFEFTNQTKINLTADFFLNGRENESKSLLNLTSVQDQHRIKSKSKDEAYGFILATLINVEDANCRCLIIKSQEAWDFMATSEQSLILIPYGFSPTGIGAATAKGHTVLIAVDDKDTPSESICLSRQPRLIREEGFKKLWPGDNKDSEDNARVLYRETKGYFEPLLRHPLLRPIDYKKPTWSNNASLDVLFAALFASTWNEDNEYDCQAMKVLSGLSYSDFKNNITHLSHENDPPIRKIGNQWQVIAKIDFWLLIAPKIAEPYLQRLGKIAPVILADEDPYHLPTNERYMASILGAVPKYSSFLKKAIADSLALLSAFGDEFSEQLGYEKSSSLVCGWIRKVFEENKNVKFWFSVQGCLRLLAEAAPDVFLNAVESALEGENPILLGLFTAEGDGVFGGSYHSDLLWALELISWNKDYLVKVSQCLARLSEIDPGGTYAKRPFKSLVDIYLGWINNTSATHDERLTILRKILIREYPKVSWDLMIALLLNNTLSSSGICKPEYRDWTTNVEASITNQAYLNYVEAIVDLLLDNFDKTYENIDNRIINLVNNFTFYTEEQVQTIIKRMLSIKAEDLSDEQRKKIVKEIIGIVARHKRFPDTKWSWAKELLDQVEKVAHHFDFKDVVKANLFLFNAHVPVLIDLINIDDYDYKEREALLIKKRISVLESIYQEQGIDGIKELIVNCSLPRLVGSIAFLSSFSKTKSSNFCTLAVLSGPETLALSLLWVRILEKWDVFSKTLYNLAIEWLDIDDNLGEFSKGFFLTLSHNKYEEAKNITIENTNWSSIKKAKFLLCMPLTTETLELVDSIPEEGRQHFWSNLNHYIVPDKQVELVSSIASRLLENDRPRAAIDALAQLFLISQNLSELDSNLVANILIGIATNPNEGNRMSIQEVSHDILKAIEFLQDAGTIPEREVSYIEWLYLKFFRYEAFSPRYLMKSVAENPSDFAQLVIWSFRRNDNKQDPVEDLTEELLRQRVEIAYRLLEKVSILPGQTGDQIDLSALKEWIRKARESLKEAGRLDIGDIKIGEYLSRCPNGTDNIWPHESVRDIIEQVKSEKLERGIICGHRNSRGVTLRRLYDGGEQERSLAEKYASDVESIRFEWPRTADILKVIAQSYEREAEVNDISVEIMD